MGKTKQTTELQARVLSAFSKSSTYGLLLEHCKGKFIGKVDAEDALHDFFVYFWTAAGEEGRDLQFPEDTEQALKYLKRSLNNDFLMKIRRAKKVKEAQKNPSTPEKHQQGSAERYGKAMERLITIVEKRVSLTRQQRRLWELMQEWTPVEIIMEDLGISQQNAYSQRSKLAAKIRQYVSYEELFVD